MFPSIDDMEHVYIIKPSNDFGPWCFPKGRQDKGESLQETALREVREESGVPAKIMKNGYLGTGKGSKSITHYYAMVQNGPMGKHDFETEEVRLVTLDEAEALFAGAGNSRDVTVLKRLLSFIESNVIERPLDEIFLHLT